MASVASPNFSFKSWILELANSKVCGKYTQIEACVTKLLLENPSDETFPPPLQRFEWQCYICRANQILEDFISQTLRIIEKIPLEEQAHFFEYFFENKGDVTELASFLHNTTAVDWDTVENYSKSIPKIEFLEHLKEVDRIARENLYLGFPQVFEVVSISPPFVEASPSKTAEMLIKKDRRGLSISIALFSKLPKERHCDALSCALQLESEFFSFMTVLQAMFTFVDAEEEDYLSATHACLNPFPDEERFQGLLKVSSQYSDHTRLKIQAAAIAPYCATKFEVSDCLHELQQLPSLEGAMKMIDYLIKHDMFPFFESLKYLNLYDADQQKTVISRIERYHDFFGFTHNTLLKCHALLPFECPERTKLLSAAKTEPRLDELLTILHYEPSQEKRHHFVCLLLHSAKQRPFDDLVKLAGELQNILSDTEAESKIFPILPQIKEADPALRIQIIEESLGLDAMAQAALLHFSPLSTEEWLQLVQLLNKLPLDECTTLTQFLAPLCKVETFCNLIKTSLSLTPKQRQDFISLLLGQSSDQFESKQIIQLIQVMGYDPTYTTFFLYSCGSADHLDWAINEMATYSVESNQLSLQGGIRIGEVMQAGISHLFYDTLPVIVCDDDRRRKAFVQLDSPAKFVELCERHVEVYSKSQKSIREFSQFIKDFYTRYPALLSPFQRLFGLASYVQTLPMSPSPSNPYFRFQEELPPIAFAPLSQTVSGRSVAFVPRHFCEAAKQYILTRSAIPKDIHANSWRELCEPTIAWAAANPQDAKTLSIEHTGFAWETLLTPMQRLSIHALFDLDEREEVSLLSVQFACIINFLKTQDRNVLLIAASGIQYCNTGRSEGIALYYNSLPDAFKYKADGRDSTDPDQDRAFEYLARLTQRYLQDCCASRALLTTLCKGAVEQESHHSLYIKNMIGEVIGLQYERTFDINLSCVSMTLLQMERVQILETFYQHATPQGLAHALVQAFSNSQGPARKSLYSILREIRSDVWEWDEDGVYADKECGPLSLTLEGARNLLTTSGYFCDTPPSPPALKKPQFDA